MASHDIGEGNGLDPQNALDLDYNMVAGALYEGLYHFTPDGKLEPGLADGLPEISDGGLVYTIRLKPGAMFAGPDFEPREVKLGRRGEGYTEIASGLAVGEEVVVSATFLIDAESNLKAALQSFSQGTQP